MAINSYICPNCTHFSVCKVNDKLLPFTKEGDKDLGVTITINECVEYKEVD